MNEEIVDLFEKQAAYEGVDLDALSDEELAYVYNNFVENLEEELEDELQEEAEEEAYEKLAEAEILGRHMARSYMDELDELDFYKLAAKGDSDKQSELNKAIKRVQDQVARMRADGVKKKKINAYKSKAMAEVKAAHKKRMAKRKLDVKKARSAYGRQQKFRQQASDKLDAQRRFYHTEKGKRISEDAQINEILKRRKAEEKAQKAQARLVAEQDMTKEQKAARNKANRMKGARVALQNKVKDFGKKIDRNVQTLGTALGGEAGKAGKRSRRLRGYGALAGAGAALGAGAYGASQMGKEASYEVFELEALNRAEEMLEFGKEAGLDADAVDTRALEILTENGYDISPMFEDDYDDDDYGYEMSDDEFEELDYLYS